MRPTLVYLIVYLTVVRPIHGSRLDRLEDDVKSLKSFIFRELSSIRDEVKEISNRVDILENTTVTHDHSSASKEMDITSYNIGDKTGEIGKQIVRAGNNEGSHVVIAKVQNMHKVYAKDKKDLHQLKQDVIGQLRELEQKITSHMHNLTADVQHNIQYIHENISLANITLSDFINGSSTNLSVISLNIKMEINALSANTSKQLELRINQTETKIKHNITSTYRQYEDKIETLILLADRNISEMILEADSIVSVIRTNFSEIPNQISNLSLELQSVNKTIFRVEDKLTHEIDSKSIILHKQISILFTCSKHFIANKITIQNGYFYPCAKDIRLANVYPYQSTGVQGRLEVRHDSKWGTVCDDSFQHDHVGGTHVTNNLNVVCRMFGFQECDYVMQAGLGVGRGDIWMDEVKCVEGESSFLECPHRGWGDHNCIHSEDVGFRMWN